MYAVDTTLQQQTEYFEDALPDAVIGSRGEAFTYSTVITHHVASFGWRIPDGLTVANSKIEFEFEPIEVVIDVYDHGNLNQFPPHTFSKVWIDWRYIQYGYYDLNYLLAGLNQLGVREYSLFIPEVNISKQIVTGRLQY